MEKSITQLSAQDILDKEFKTGIRGYNQEEVDEFLDMIILDYQAYDKKINELQSEIKNLRRRIDTEQSRSHSPQRTQQVNYDILQRLSNLEKEVFGRSKIGRASCRERE